MKIKANFEIHMLQTFSPNGMNAGEGGMPKRVDFGGENRRYISSQSQKYALKEQIEEFIQAEWPTDGRESYRTRQLHDILFHSVTSDHNKDRAEAKIAVKNFIEGLGLRLSDKNQTQYLLYLGRREIENLVETCLVNWDALVSSTGQRRKGQVDRSLVATDGGALHISSLLDGGQAIQLALTGRMVADFPEVDIRSATQVSHAIATGRSALELDFYSGVDDFLTERGVSSGAAGMMGYSGLMSNTMYRYMNVDVAQLYANLQEDAEMTKNAMGLAVEGWVRSVPSGKVNSTAPFNMPDFVMVVLRRDHPWNLANAFVPGITGGGPHGVIGNSVAALDDYWGKMVRMYGGEDILAAWVVTSVSEDLLNNVKDFVVPSLSDLTKVSVERISVLTLPEGNDS